MLSGLFQEFEHGHIEDKAIQHGRGVRGLRLMDMHPGLANLEPGDRQFPELDREARDLGGLDGDLYDGRVVRLGVQLGPPGMGFCPVS